MERLSRRDFLKLAVAGGTGLFGWKFSKFGEVELDTTEEVISTQTANFYGFFESHTNRVSYGKELERMGIVPDIHFVEMVTRESAKEFQNSSDSTDVLFWHSMSSDGKTNYGPFLDVDTLVYFARKAISVAYEGIKVIRSDNFFEGALSVGQDLVSGTALLLREKYSKNSEDQTEQSLLKLGEKLSEENPGDIVIRLRSILIARKLQVMGKYLSDNLNRKAEISFSIGLLHKSSFMKCLNAGPDQTLKEMDGISTNVLRKMVETNGGVETFSRVLVIPVQEVLVNKTNVKNILCDVNLRDYLENRLG